MFLLTFGWNCRESDGADGLLSDQAGVAIEADTFRGAGMDHQDGVLRDSSSVAAIVGGEKQQ